jgi:hypothetical protein
LEIYIVGFLRVVGCCSALVMEILIADLCFCSEDCCDGAVIFPCAAIEICGFPRGDVVLRLLLLAYFLLILAMLPDACTPLDLQVLVV